MRSAGKQMTLTRQILLTLITSCFMAQCLAAAPTSPPSGAGASSLDKTTPVGSSRTPTSLIVPIDALLRNLRNGDISHAYNDTTSADFKSATTIEAFTAFVNHNPILIKHKTIELKTNDMQDLHASITVTLDPGKTGVPVNFMLVKENGQWKIWHLSLTPLYSIETLALMKDTAAMHKPIEGQLQALQDGNIPRAYQNFTSEAFRKATTLDAFRAYIKDFPMLTQKGELDFKDPVFDKGTSIIEVHLNGVTASTELEYTVGIEDDEWKVWGVKVLKQLAKVPSATTPEAVGDPANVTVSQTKQAEDGKDAPNGPLEISRIDIGGRQDINTPKTNPLYILKANQGDIYVNLYIRRGIFGTKIELQMIHLDSGTKIPSISTTLQQDGNLMVSFVFTPPLAGWPTGHYLLTSTASTGAQRTLTFSVE